MSDLLSALDATFLELEQENDGVLMSIGGVMVFDPPAEGKTPSLREVRERVAGRLAGLPRYRQRLSSPRVGGLGWPRWVEDQHFDIAGHVSHVALPGPGGSAELCDWAADFYSHRLDRNRPLWEMVMVEGLADGRWALAHKTHHCLVDGVGSVDVAEILLDRHPTPAASTRCLTAQPATANQTRWRAPQPITQAAGASRRGAEMALRAALHPREAVARARALAGLIVYDELLAAPPSSINVPIGSSRRFAVVSVPMAELRAIRGALGGSVNDVVLAACTNGLRKLLLERSEQPPVRGLRAMVPMNTRQASERAALGNRVSSLFVELPVAAPTAHSRYRQIRAATARLKRSGAATGASTMLDLAALAPPVLHAVLARSLYVTRLFNLTITNVPGPQQPLYALGSRLREVQPVVPLAAEHAVGVAAFSYAGTMTFGVIADAASTPDIAVLACGIEEGVEQLLARVPDRDQEKTTEQARI